MLVIDSSVVTRIKDIVSDLALEPTTSEVMSDLIPKSYIDSKSARWDKNSNIEFTAVLESDSSSNKLGFAYSEGVLEVYQIERSESNQIAGRSGREKNANDYSRLSEKLDELFDKSMYKKIGSRILLNSNKSLKTYYPKLFNAMMSFDLYDDPSCPTLYVTYNESRKRLEMHYNTEFIAQGAITELIYTLSKSNPSNIANLTDEDFSNYLTGIGTFYFMHEIYHVIFRHITDDSESGNNYSLDRPASQKLPPGLENYPADAYINTLLTDIYNNNPMVISVLKKLNLPSFELNTGITKSFNFSGEVSNRLFTDLALSTIPDAVLRGYLTMASMDIQLFRVYGELSTIARDLRSNPKATLFMRQWTSPNSDSYDSFANNTRVLTRVIFNTDDPEKVESRSNAPGNGPDQDQGDQQQPSRSSSGDRPKDSQPQQGSSQSSDRQSSGDQSQQGSDQRQSTNDQSSASQSSNKEGGSANSDQGDDGGSQGDPVQRDQGEGTGRRVTKNPKGKVESTKDIPSEIDRTLKDAAKEVQSSSHNKRDVSKDIQRIIDSAESSGGVSKSWRKKLRRMIEQSSGITIKYNPEAPNSRLEGQMGRETIDKKLGDVVFSFDISSSMNISDFKAALVYIQDMMKMNLKFDRVGFSYWTTEHYEVRPRRIAPSMVYTQAKNNCPSTSGLTPIGSMVDSFLAGKLKGIKPDLIVVFTDGELQGPLSSAQKSWISRNKRRLLWVLKKGSQSNVRMVLSFDPTAKNRIVVMTDTNINKRK